MIALLVAKNEFIRSLKNKKKLLLMLLLPLISIILAIGTNSLMKPSINIGIIGNEDKSNYIEEKINNIDRIKVSKANKETINTDMILAKYLGVVEFKEDNNFNVYCLDNNMKESLEEAISETFNNERLDKIAGLLDILDEGSLSAAQRSSGFIFITVMITCIISAITIIKDKEDGVLMRFSISSNKISSYVLGKFIYTFINTIVQISISILLIYLLKIDIGISIGQLFIICLVISIIASSITILVTVISNSELQGSLITSAIALIISLFGGAFLPIDKMPEALKFISNISIAKWIINLTSSIENGLLYRESFIIITAILLLSLSILFMSMKVGERNLTN